MYIMFNYWTDHYNEIILCNGGQFVNVLLISPKEIYAQKMF